MKPKKLKQKLAALLSCVLSISCILSSMPVIAAPVEKELENFALNCSYKTSGAANSSYPDTDGKELTDGVIGSTSYGDAPWAAFLYVADVSFTVDLGSVKDLSSIEGVFLNSQSSGGIPYPEWVKASYSTDGSSWTEETSETFAEAPLDSVYTYKHSFASPVSARFVRLTCPTAGWVFISEIRALGAKKVAPPDPPTPPAEEKNLAFNCSYETSGAANSSYPDTDGKELTDGIVGSSSFADAPWIGFLYVADVNLTVDLGSVKSFSSVEGVFLNGKNHGGIPYPEWVKVSYSADGTEWTEELPESFAETAPIDSVYTYKHNFASTVSARFVRLTCPTAGWVFISEMRVLEGKDEEPPIPPTPTSKNLLLGQAYTSLLQDGDFHGDHKDLSRKKLSDGLKAKDWKSANSVGIYAVGALTFFELNYVMPEPITFKQIDIGALVESGSGIGCPTKVVIQTRNSATEQWTTLYNGAVSGEDARTNLVFASAGESFTAKEIRFGFEAGNTWTFFDELEVFADRNDETAAYPLVEQPPEVDDGNNLAKGRPYTVSNPANSTYPDTSSTELTDGFVGRSTFQDPAWVGFLIGYTYDPLEIIVDLGEKKSFEEVGFNAVQSPGYGINLPENIEILVSDDQKAWTKMNVGAPRMDVVVDLGSEQSFERIKTGFLKAEGQTDEPIYHYIYQAEKAIEGRYVKVKFNYSPWAFVDEITVLHKIKEDKSASATALNELTSNVTPTIDANNLAYGRSYESQWASNEVRPDNGTKLTDGRRAGGYQSIDWVGYGSARGIGAYQSANRVSAPLPKSMEVSISNDKINWKLLAADDLPSFEDASSGVHRFDCALASAVSARYVKFTMSIDDAVYMDEIEILKKNDGSADADKNPDNGAFINLVENYDYTVSRKSSSGNGATGLTDGVSGNPIAIDDSWAGFRYVPGNQWDNHVTLQFDLSSMNSVAKILLGTKAAENGVALPKNLTIKGSYNGTEWNLLKSFGNTFPEGNCIWEGSVDFFHSSVAGATMAYTRYLKIEFDLTEGCTTYVDEVEIIGKRERCSDAGLIINPLGELYNVALEKPYVTSPVENPPDFPDTNHSELTDGMLGSTDYKDPEWVGSLMKYLPTGDADESWPLKSTIIDLKGIKTVTSIKFHMLTANLPVGYVNQPFSTRTFASMDGKNWVPLSENLKNDVWKSGINSYGWNIDGAGVVPPIDLTGGLEMIAAKYIRVDVELVNWTMMDEIEVMGYNGQKEGVPLAEGTLKLDKGQEYLKPGVKTGGIHDLVLLYNGDYGVDPETNTRNGDWSAEALRPYLTYIDESDKAVDTMFDGVLFLALTSQYGNSFPDVDPNWSQSTPPSLKDWEWCIDNLFGEGGDVPNLNKAAEIASKELGNPNYKIKMVLTIPGLPNVTDFGTLNGRSLNLQKKEDCEYLLDWFMDSLLQKVEEGDYKYIDFTGFYWLEESVGYFPNGPLFASKKAHEAGKMLYWIPYYDGAGNLWHETLGFDASAIQPNHYFGNENFQGDLGTLGNSRVEKTAGLASYANAGVEFEMDEAVTNNIGSVNKFIDYLNGAIEFGFGGPDVYKAWYQGVHGMSRACNSAIPEVRSLYDYSYQLMKGTLTKKLDYVTHYSSGGSGIKPDDNSSIGGSGGSVRPKPTNPTVPENPSTENPSWEKTNGVWRLKGSDGKYITGWAKVNGVWYYMNADSVMQKGWQKIGNTWYYLKASGAMATGWQKIGNAWYYLKDSGAMATGWQWIGGKCYYLNAQGQMAANTTIGGYKVGADGAWIH